MIQEADEGQEKDVTLIVESPETQPLCSMTSFEMKHPIDLSIDPSRVQNDNPSGLMSPTNDARYSRITGARGGATGGGTGGDFSNFCDDSKMMELLINAVDDNEDGAGDHVLFDEIDMGQIDEEERQYLLIDKDTGRVYDLRNEDSLRRITSKQTRLTTDLSSSSGVTPPKTQASKGSAWSDWWRDKKRNNHDLLWAAESGNVEEVRRLLDRQGPLQDLAADVNHRGLDNWTALHFAASEGRLDVVKELFLQPDCERDALSSINRTPLHLAAIRGHTSIVRLILEGGRADCNCRDCDDSTPLHYASEYGHIECIIYLVKEASADPFLKNKFGYTPSDIA